jgi:hypothetical protein
MGLLPRGRVAKWDREKIDTLSTPELRQLMVNAEQLSEPEIAAMCREILDVRPRGHAAVRRLRPNGVRRLVTRGKAFEIRGVPLASRTYSRSGIREEDGKVMFAVPFTDIQKSDTANSALLWAPNVSGSHPWSDKPGGKERLEHCKVALQRGEAEAMLAYEKGMDADQVLRLKVEQRGEEYWATWSDIRRTTVTNMK